MTPATPAGFRLRVAAPTPGEAELLLAIRMSVRENHRTREELEAVGMTTESLALLLGRAGRGWVAETVLEREAAAYSVADAAEGNVLALFVRPEFEGHGLGSLLLARAEAWLWSRGRSEIWLDTGAGPGLRARPFYERRGWLLQEITTDGLARYAKPRPPQPGV